MRVLVTRGHTSTLPATRAIPRLYLQKPRATARARYLSRMASITVQEPSKPSPQPDDARLKAHHNKDGKGFINPWQSFQDVRAWDIFKWVFKLQVLRQGKTPDTTPPTVPVHAPEFLPTRETAKLRATWLGHACYYVEFPSGLRVLFDPVFTQRCSPFSFIGPKRYTEMPCRISALPFIDAVVISHNHYDHLSHPTLLEIAKLHPDVRFFVPLGNKAWFDDAGFRNVTELDWWEERELRVTLPDSGQTVTNETTMTAVFSALPCQHTSARTAFDKAHTLWASWAVSSGGRKVWFGGDTGYRSVPRMPSGEFDYGERYAHLPHCPAFKQIGELRGPFDLGLIPIGAYDPRYLMSSVHANPYDSVNIFVDTKCRRALGIHWGTWVLTNEDVLEPPQMLRQALKWKDIAEEGVFDVCDIGDSREI